MSQNDREKLNRLEDLKTKLSSKNFESDFRRHDNYILHPKDKVPESWQDENAVNNLNGNKFMKKTSFKKFFIFSIVFFILAMAYASYMFFLGGNTVSNNNIEIAVFGNTFTDGGEELPLQIEITNKNSSALQLADLVVEYPKSSSSASADDMEHYRSSLGTVPSGGVKNENVKVVLFGEQGSVRTLKILLEYRVEGSNAIFIKEKIHQVSINSAPINLITDAPTEASPNQEVVLKVKATLNATKAASKILLRADYPLGFQFEQAVPAPSFGNNVWSLGDLSPGAEKEIAITGKMVDAVDGEEKTFHIFSGSESDGDKSAIGTVFNSLGHTILIKKPFIDAQLYINGVYQQQYASDTNSLISGQIRWVNNLDTKINDMQITAKISGNAYDKKTISSQEGFYDSASNTIIWSKNSSRDFAEVNPGDSGSVDFSLSPLSLFSDNSGMLSSPSINIEVSISGKQPEEGNLVTDIKNSETKTIKIISDLGFASKVLYFSGPFQNTGPIPPKAEQETTYTVVWTLSNTANNISSAKVVSSLPPWIKFSEHISPGNEDLVFDPLNKSVTWNIGGIPRGTGITNGTREVSFQVSLNPSSSQVGTAPILINDAVLTGHDDFANLDVRVSKSSLSTRLSNDAQFPAKGETVIE